MSRFLSLVAGSVRNLYFHPLHRSCPTLLITFTAHLIWLCSSASAQLPVHYLQELQRISLSSVAVHPVAFDVAGGAIYLLDQRRGQPHVVQLNLEGQLLATIPLPSHAKVAYTMAAGATGQVAVIGKTKAERIVLIYHPETKSWTEAFRAEEPICTLVFHCNLLFVASPASLYLSDGVSSSRIAAFDPPAQWPVKLLPIDETSFILIDFNTGVLRRISLRVDGTAEVSRPFYPDEPGLLFERERAGCCEQTPATYAATVGEDGTLYVALTFGKEQGVPVLALEPSGKAKMLLQMLSLQRTFRGRSFYEIPMIFTGVKVCQGKLFSFYVPSKLVFVHELPQVP